MGPIPDLSKHLSELRAGCNLGDGCYCAKHIQATGDVTMLAGHVGYLRMEADGDMDRLSHYGHADAVLAELGEISDFAHRMDVAPQQPVVISLIMDLLTPFDEAVVRDSVEMLNEAAMPPFDEELEAEVLANRYIEPGLPTAGKTATAVES